MRDKMVFFQSYYKAIKELPAGPEREALIIALLSYMFEGEEPPEDFNFWQRALFESWRKNVDNSADNEDNGKRGGRPSKKGVSKNENPPFENGKPPFSESENPPLSNPKTTRLDKTRQDETRQDKTGLDGTKTKGGKRPREEITDPEIRKAFDEFADMRQRMRKPMTVRAEELVLKELWKLSADAFGDMIPDKAVKILEQSIVKGWTDVYPLKDGKQNSQKIDWDSV